jgi:putative ABC transport system ATP-binding protein
MEDRTSQNHGWLCFSEVPTLSAEDNIRIVQSIADRTTAFDPVFRAVLRLLGIADRMNHKLVRSREGQQVRVAIARGIVNSPGILLADEPAGNLDSENSAAVLRLTKDLNHRLG